MMWRLQGILHLAIGSLASCQMIFLQASYYFELFAILITAESLTRDKTTNNVDTTSMYVMFHAVIPFKWSRSENDSCRWSSGTAEGGFLRRQPATPCKARDRRSKHAKRSFSVSCVWFSILKVAVTLPWLVSASSRRRNETTGSYGSALEGDGAKGTFASESAAAPLHLIEKCGTNLGATHRPGMNLL